MGVVRFLVLLCLLTVFPVQSASAANATAAEMSAVENAIVTAEKTDTQMSVFERFSRIQRSIRRGFESVEKRVVTVLEDQDDDPSGLGQAWRNLGNGSGGFAAFGSLFTALCVFLAAFLVEWPVRRGTARLVSMLKGSPSSNIFLKIGKGALLAALRGIYFAVYLLAFSLISSFVAPPGTGAQVACNAYIVAVTQLRVMLILTGFVFAPYSPNLRLVPMSDEYAQHLRKWLTVIFIISPFTAWTIFMLRELGISNHLFTLLFCFEIIPPTIILLYLIWRNRKAMSEHFLFHVLEPEEDSFSVRFSKNWHWYASAYVLLLVFAREIMLLQGSEQAGAVLICFVLLPFFLGLDRLSWSVLLQGSNVKPGERPPHGALMIQRAVSILLVLTFFVVLFDVWGIELTAGERLGRSVIAMVLTMITGYFLWEVVRSAIDKRLAEEMGDEDEEMEEGGSGGSRKATLLTLLRKFIMAIFIVVVALIMLSASGIDIGPLLAGAGIFGLAIGFGAQTLVSDIISGVFFLLDDAFRIGDYVEAGSNKGTVEHISIRSIRLRHPRGQIHIIPYHSLGSVTNFSRDWVVMKLDLRVPFHTDIEKVRKIIKKINKQLAEDEVYGPKLLSKVKSQGVREIDDSALIMRVKFKTSPGEQFGLRRVVYQRIRDNFAENGIEFAPKKVTVHIPDIPSGLDVTSPQGKAVLAGAAEQAIAQDEASQAEKS